MSSHCNFCNACVLQFDHHCTILNQCIGVRNHKAFVIYLLLNWLMFVYLMLLTIWIIVAKDMLKPFAYQQDQQMEIILDTIIILLVAIKVIIRLCCHSVISFGYLVVWILLEIVIV